MKIKPMIFNTDMVRALMDGKKTQTRRPVSPQPDPEKNWIGWIIESSDRKTEGCAAWGDGEGCLMRKSIYARPPCKVGDLIYVRETFYQYGRHVMPAWPEAEPEDAVFSSEKRARFVGDELPENGRYFGESYWRKRPSIHMPRWASRTTLKVTSVRVERVQDISEADAVAEGFSSSLHHLPAPHVGTVGSSARAAFSDTWKKIYGDHWENNGWCWVIDFDVIHQNVDHYVASQEAA